MKRVLKVAAGLLFVALLVVAGIIGSAFIGLQPITDGVTVNGIRIVKDGIGSVGVVPVETGKVALIDGGSDDHGTPILAELSRRGLGPDAVTAILLTHGHIDHVASLPLFPKAQVMALAAEVGLVQGTEGAHGPMPRMIPVKATGVKVARVLHDGDTVMLGEIPVKVYAVPGHTRGSAAYLVNGLLFLGDAANVTSKGKVIGAPWVVSDDQAQDRASLVSLERRLVHDGTQVDAIDFAHSGVVAKGLAPLVAFARSQ